MRGMVTKEINQVAYDLLGLKEISTAELMLMPYVQYTMMNSKKLDPQRMNNEDRAILSQWRSNNWIEGGASGLTITKDFWDAINEILWLGYVND